ncbi:MAG: hypothetical protein V1859_08105 [archaeon]
MKKVIALIALLVVALSSVFATQTTLDDDSITMAYEDTAVVTYCIEEEGTPVNIAVVVSPVCRELDNVLGCSAGDTMNPTGFSVVPNEPTTGADGCVELTITTTLNENQAGVYVYTVNGDNGTSYVGAETGKVYVPEFTVIGSLAVLGIAGYIAARKRKN